MYPIRIGALICSIHSIKLIKKQSSVKAEVCIKIEVNSACSMNVSGFKVMGKGDKLWLKAPQVSFKDKGGGFAYKDIIRFKGDDDDVSEIWNRLSEMVIEAYDHKIHSADFDNVRIDNVVKNAVPKDKYDGVVPDEDLVFEANGWVDRTIIKGGV